METFGIVGLGIFLLLCVYCSFQESKVISPYKAHNVFGRLKAYLAMDFTLAGFMMWLASTFAPLFPSLDIANNMGIVGVIFGTALFGAGLMMYYITYINCPDELKKDVLLICGLLLLE